MPRITPHHFETHPVFDALLQIASMAVPAISGLVGVAVGACLTSRREQKQRQLAFIEKQLSMFYSPMLGLRNEVKTHSAFRVRVQNEADAAWRQLCEDLEDLDVHERQRIVTDRGSEFSRIIEYDNIKLNVELLPAYQKMVDLFRESYWLAEQETREYYGGLVEFVEVWNRWNDKALPTEVLKRLEHSEGNLAQFYEHIERTHDVIRKKLKSGE